MKKNGRQFEELVDWIQRSVHRRAEIAVNQKIRDVDTEGLRQVDITISLSDGPTAFFGIVEVRDRSRPVGVRYVEQVYGKQRSVGADAAFIVSRSGFAGTAITKAQALGIRALTYAEAKEGDWSNWLRCRTFTVQQRKYDNALIILFRHGTNDTIKVSPTELARCAKDPTAKIVLGESGIPLVSVPDLIRQIVNCFGEQPYNGIALDGSRHRRSLLFKRKFEPTLWVKAEDNSLHQIGDVRIEADLYWDCSEYPFRLMRYRAANKTASIAEVATTEVKITGKKYRLECLATGAGDHIPAGGTLSLRSVPLQDDAGRSEGKDE